MTLSAYCVAAVVLGILLMSVGSITAHSLLHAWLVATLFFLGLSLGALTLVMIHGLTGGRWGEMIAAPLLTIASPLPLMLLAMALPVFRFHDILPWAAAEPAGLAEEARAKLSYFGPAFFIARNLLTFFVWLGVARSLSIWARRGAAPVTQAAAIIGLLLLMVTMVFFTTDWMMAPDPSFSSTIYPILELSGETTGALSLAIAMASNRLDESPESSRGVLVAEDLANLLFGFVLLWAYFSFMQWLIVWSGNLPPEIGWYLRRGEALWLTLLIIAMALHLVIPTAMLLSRSIKRSTAGLVAISAMVLIGHFADVFWRLGPDGGASDLIGAFGAFLLVGGVWCIGLVWLSNGAIRHRQGSNARA